jgi:hypothetical protein
MMFYLCASLPELTNLQISWSEAMDLPIGLRNSLVRLLDEVRGKQISEIKRASRRR